MKGIICLYSGSGNTKLACRYLMKNISSTEFVLFNIVTDGIPDMNAYDVVGFACFTDFFGPSRLMLDFIEKIPAANKPAFVLNTYGYINGRTQLVLGQEVGKKGFDVVAGYSLHTPESYPPMIARGMGNEDAPDEKELASFKTFISELDSLLREYAAAGKASKKLFSPGIGSRLLPMFSRDKARKDMGEKFIDEQLCTKCGICAKGCPCGAITLDPLPVFDMKRCSGCWFCYNHCPEKAVYTKKFRNIAHYPSPNEQLREKLKV